MVSTNPSRLVRLAEMIRFERPPVREVSLTLYFDVIESLRVGHLAPLRQAWRSMYPRVDETVPRPDWAAGEVGILESLTENSPWPFPSVWFGSEDSDSSVRLQHDRFILTWRFSSDDASDASYPGYDELKPELMMRFDEFGQCLSEEIGESVQVRRIELRYNNEFYDVRSSDLIRIIAAGPNAASEGILDGADYSGMRVHYCASSENSDCSVLVGVDSSEQSEGARLFIEVSSDVADADIWTVTDTIHDVVLEQFMKLTTEAMRANWRPIDGA